MGIMISFRLQPSFFGTFLCFSNACHFGVRIYDGGYGLVAHFVDAKHMVGRDFSFAVRGGGLALACRCSRPPHVNPATLVCM